MLRIRRNAPSDAAARLELPSAFADAAAARVEIIRDFADPHLELVRLLREATEIEHALMVREKQGAWGGATERERRRVMSQRRRTA